MEFLQNLDPSNPLIQLTTSNLGTMEFIGFRTGVTANVACRSKISDAQYWLRNIADRRLIVVLKHDLL